MGAGALYLAVAAVALFADRVAGSIDVDPLRIEAVLLTLLLFLSVNLAFAMLFTRSDVAAHADR